MSISKIAGIGLVAGTAGLAGCASSSTYLSNVNKETAAMVEQYAPNTNYDSLAAVYGKNEKFLQPDAAVLTRDFAVRAQKDAEIASLKAQYKKELAAKSDSIMFLNAESQSQKVAYPARLQMALDSADNYWTNQMINQDAYYVTKFEAAKDVCEAEKDSLFNNAKKRIAYVRKQLTAKLNRQTFIADSLAQVSSTCQKTAANCQQAVTRCNNKSANELTQELISKLPPMAKWRF